MNAFRDFERVDNSSEGPSDSRTEVRATKAEEFFVHVSSTIEAVEELRSIWGEWTHSIDTDIDYYLYKLRKDPTVVRPYVITVGHGRITEAMLVGLVREQRVSSIVAFINILGPKARILEIGRGARVGDYSSAIDRALAIRLSEALKSNEVDFVCFQRLSLRSRLFQEIEQHVALRAKRRVSYVHAPVLPLATPAGKPFQSASGKLKRELRRKRRVLNRAFPQEPRFTCFSTPQELETGIQDAMIIATKNWKYKFGWGLLGTLQVRKELDFLAERGWLRIYLLYVEDSPAAFLVGQLYNGVFYYKYAGYQARYERFAVGWLLTEWTLEHLAAAGVVKVDFGESEQDCNRRLGCKSSQDASVHVYAPTPLGLCLDVFFSTTQTAKTVCRGLLTTLRLNRAKRIWRDLLVAIRSRKQLEQPRFDAPQESEDSAIPDTRTSL